MARWSISCQNWTPTAVADTTNFTAPYMALQGGTSTQRIQIIEVYMGGLAGASSPTLMVLAFDSTAFVTASPGGRLTPLDTATAALGTNPVFSYNAATQPQRGATGHKLALAYNAFGGIVKWTAAPGEEILQSGASANTGEHSLTAFTGGTPGAMSAHIIFEPF